MRDPAFEAIVARLRADDPEFTRRVQDLGGPPSAKRVRTALFLWIVAPFLVMFGGWTGFLLAVVAVLYGAYLKWSGSLYAAARSRRPLPRRRHPGASL